MRALGLFAVLVAISPGWASDAGVLPPPVEAPPGPPSRPEDLEVIEHLELLEHLDESADLELLQELSREE